MDEFETKKYDVVVVGAGGAGLALAALCAGRRKGSSEES